MFGKVKHRRRVGQFDQGGSCDRVLFDFGVGVRQWPRSMVDLAAVDLALLRRIKAIAFGEEVFEGRFVAEEDRCDGPVSGLKIGVCAMALGRITNGSVFFARTHGSVEIGEMVESAGRPHCGKVRRIEAEEVDSRLVPITDISAHVQFRKTRETWNRRDATGANAAHPEGDDAHPALSIEAVQTKLLGNEGSEYGRW